LCLDERNGMLFNHRRQSRDSAVLEDIRSRVTGELGIDPMSRKLVAGAGIPYLFVLPEITEPIEGLHFFVEARKPGQWVGFASTVVLYRWNRRYPADMYFDIDLEAMGFHCVETAEFPGTSHEKITREVYVR